MIRLLEILKEPNNYSDYLNNILKKYEIDINYLEQYYENVKTNKMYKSPFHGLYHSEKVCIYALILAKFYGLDEIETQIIRDAALYHDIGRMNDFEESTHGLVGSKNIDEVIDKNNKAYLNPENLIYLKAIIEAHSLSSQFKDIIFENYKYEYPNLDYNKYERLYNILLDSDALDRTRFNRISSAALKEEFLRTDEAKNLIDFAINLNKYYFYIQSKNNFNRLYNLYNTNDPNKIPHGCFHGISSNFFALDSILKYGILSEFAMQELGIISPRNFLGNNNNMFISVVEDISYSKNGKANKKFLKENISLYCLVTNLSQGIKKTENFSDSMPTNSDEYEDETFAFYKIAKEQIHSIVLPKNMINKDIQDLTYMEGSRNYDLISQKVYFYLNKLKEHMDNTPYVEKLEPLLNQYRECVINFEKLNENEQKRTINIFLKNIDNILNEINIIIQEIVNIIWHIILNIDFSNQITIKEVINHILVSNNINFSMQDSGDELLFIIHHQKKIQNTI